MGEKKGFFAKAFEDMKESARAQREVDRAEFEAVRMENRAQWEEAKRLHMPAERRKELDDRLAGANARIAQAQERLKAIEDAQPGDPESEQ